MNRKSWPTNTASFWSTDVAMGGALWQMTLISMPRWKTSCALSVRALIWSGQSSGALLYLLAAAVHPNAVWTLAVIEPTAASIARGNEAVERLVARLAPLFPPDAVMSPEQFAAAFYQALGFDAHRLSWISDTRQPLRSLHVSQCPGMSKCPLDRLAAAPFRKLVVSGAWEITPPLAREIAGSVFRVICDVLEKKLPAERAIFRGAAYNPQLLGKQFNDRLRLFSAARSRI